MLKVKHLIFILFLIGPFSWGRENGDAYELQSQIRELKNAVEAYSSLVIEDRDEIVRERDAILSFMDDLRFALERLSEREDKTEGEKSALANFNLAMQDTLVAFAWHSRRWRFDKKIKLITDKRLADLLILHGDFCNGRAWDTMASAALQKINYCDKYGYVDDMIPCIKRMFNSLEIDKTSFNTLLGFCERRNSYTSAHSELKAWFKIMNLRVLPCPSCPDVPQCV